MVLSEGHGVKWKDMILSEGHEVSSSFLFSFSIKIDHNHTIVSLHRVLCTQQRCRILHDPVILTKLLKPKNQL